MTKKEFISKYHLVATKTKCWFYDGRAEKYRTLYIRANDGAMFVFYDKDLHIFHANEPYIEGMEFIRGHLGAGYSWYH